MTNKIYLQMASVSAIVKITQELQKWSNRGPDGQKLQGAIL